MQRREPTLDGASLPTADAPTADARLDRAPTAVVEPASGGGSSSFLAIIALILALAGLGAAAFLYQQWQLAQEQMVDAQQRIVQLEQRFEMSGEESAASVEVLGVKLKENSSEIRKLWGVAHDTNRKNIAANQASAASQKKTIDALGSKLNSLSASVKQIAALEASLAELRQLSNQDSREVKDTVAKLGRQLASVRSDLTMRVGANEEAVQSIDAYRRSVNKDLVQLRDAIRNLQSSSSTALSQ